MSNKQQQEVQLKELLRERLTRRELLQYGGVAGVSLSTIWALACQPAAPAPTPTKAPVAVAPTPTTPPTPVAPTPTKAPPPTPTMEKIGKHLIGKLEGPETITDPAKFPKTFKEAPAWAELVKAGKLPPAKERIGEDPLVIKPLREIGRYGGTWRRGFTGPADKWGGYRCAGYDYILYWDYAGNKIMPNIAKGWELSADGRTTTVFLRRGMRWSDGQPFTADDFVFWFQDMYHNKDLVPTLFPDMAIKGKQGTMERVDTYTVRFKFPDPYYMFPDMLAGSINVLAGQALGGPAALGGYAPAHYLKQFHPKYVSKEELDRKVKEAKFDNWVALLKFKNDWALNLELPVLTPWKTTSPINTPTWVLERNPYNTWVDMEGNQLPYIDKIVMTLGENLEVINLRAIAGEYDFQSRHLDLGKLPVFLANQAKGGYKVYLDPADYGADVGLLFNQNYEADPEIAKWLTNRDFRRALSLGIERDQLNETFWLGTGTPGSIAPAETTPYSPGPEYRTLWSTYDPKKANEMLDKIGLDKKDGEGYRLRTDGKGRLRLEVITHPAFIQYTQICEMIKEHWKKIGIEALVMELERSLWYRRVQSTNEAQVYVIGADGVDRPFFNPHAVLPTTAISGLGTQYGKWYVSEGKEGKEPPPRMREAMELFSKAFSVQYEERVKLTKEMFKIVLDEVWAIGTVGLAPGIYGVRVVKTNMGNIPQRLLNALNKLPGLAHPETFFWKA